MAPRGSFDALWSLDTTKLRPESEAVTRAVDDYLASERKGLNVPDPEVLLLRDGLQGAIRAAPFTWRLISAQNCHRYDRRRTKDVRVGPDRTKTVTAKEEHPVNRWFRTLSDEVVMAFIREHPQWLRNAAVADLSASGGSISWTITRQSRGLLRGFWTILLAAPAGARVALAVTI